MAGEVEKVLKEDPDIHGFLGRNHSLYTWGGNLNQAKLHLENLGLFVEVLDATAFRVFQCAWT